MGGQKLNKVDNRQEASSDELKLPFCLFLFWDTSGKIFNMFIISVLWLLKCNFFTGNILAIHKHINKALKHSEIAKCCPEDITRMSRFQVVFTKRCKKI